MRETVTRELGTSGNCAVIRAERNMDRKGNQIWQRNRSSSGLTTTVLKIHATRFTYSGDTSIAKIFRSVAGRDRGRHAVGSAGKNKSGDKSQGRKLHFDSRLGTFRALQSCALARTATCRGGGDALSTIGRFCDRKEMKLCYICTAQEVALQGLASVRHFGGRIHLAFSRNRRRAGS